MRFERYFGRAALVTAIAVVPTLFGCEREEQKQEYHTVGTSVITGKDYHVNIRLPSGELLPCKGISKVTTIYGSEAPARGRGYDEDGDGYYERLDIESGSTGCELESALRARERAVIDVNDRIFEVRAAIIKQNAKP